MFERYTERARRVVFFARYEASQYGSGYIQTEHLLLGLLREDYATVRKHLPGEPCLAENIRAEIERRIRIAERISTSMELPLSIEGKKVLTLAAGAADRLKHRWVDTEHVLVCLLELEGTTAAQILAARRLTAQAVCEQLAKAQSPQSVTASGTQTSASAHADATSSGLLILNAFIDGLRTMKAAQLLPFFGGNAEFIDATGKSWNQAKIGRNFETLFAPYAKRNATHVIESTLVDSDQMFVAVVLWKNALLASEQRAWMHRMSAVLVSKGGEWEIVLIQVTLVQPS